MRVCKNECINVCRHECIYVCIYICRYVYIHSYMHVYIHTNVHAFIHKNIYVYMYRPCVLRSAIALALHRAPSFAFGRTIFRPPGRWNLLKHVKKFCFDGIYVEPCILLGPIKCKLRYP